MSVLPSLGPTGASPAQGEGQPDFVADSSGNKSGVPIEAALAEIRRDPGLQVRASLDAETVAQYADAMKAGAEFPPVVIYDEGGTFWLSQGFHRAAAAELAGLETVPAWIRPGTRQDALWDAIGSNRDHDTSGRRRTNADKRRAVSMALEASPELSDRAIAEWVGVSHPFVAGVRESSGNRYQMDREVTRGGTTYTMKAKARRAREPGDDDGPAPDDDPARDHREPEPEPVPGPRRVSIPTNSGKLEEIRESVERGENRAITGDHCPEIVAWAQAQCRWFDIGPKTPFCNPMKIEFLFDHDIEDDNPCERSLAWYRDHWLPHLSKEILGELAEGMGGPGGGLVLDYGRVPETPYADEIIRLIRSRDHPEPGPEPELVEPEPELAPAARARGRPGPKPKLTPDRMAELRELYRAGTPQNELAKRFGIACSSVNRYVHAEDRP